MTSRSTRAFTLGETVGAVVIVCGFIAMGWVLLGEVLKAHRALAARAAVVDTATQSVTRGRNTLSTIKHDGHLFVVQDEGAILHHPDCPCLKPVVKAAAPTP